MTKVVNLQHRRSKRLAAKAEEIAQRFELAAGKLLGGRKVRTNGQRGERPMAVLTLRPDEQAREHKYYDQKIAENYNHESLALNPIPAPPFRKLR